MAKYQIPSQQVLKRLSTLRVTFETFILGRSEHRVLIRTGKPGKLKAVFRVREKSGNLKKLLEIRGILIQSGESPGNLDKKNILKYLTK